MERLEALAVEDAHEQADRHPAHLGERLAHGRQRGRDDRRVLGVVEAHDRELLGDADAALSGDAQRADRRVVVEREDRRRRLGRVEQPRGRLARRPRCRSRLQHEPRVGHHARCGHRAVEAVQALARREERASGPVITPMRAVPERQQVLGGVARARGVRRRDGRDALVERDARVDDHERVALAPQHLELLVRLLGEHQHGAVGGAVHEPVEQRHLALVLVQRRAQHHAHVLLVERLGGARRGST